MSLPQGTYLVHSRRWLWRGFCLLWGMLLLVSFAGHSTAAPDTGTWQTAADMGVPRRAFSTTLLSDGRVLVVGGINDLTFSTNRYLASAQLYNPQTNSWETTGGLSRARYEHATVKLNDGRVLVTGGSGRNGSFSVVLDSAELYDPQTGTWQVTGSMNQERKDHTATLLPDGRVLVTGGLSQGSGYLDSAEIYDPQTGTWQITDSLNDKRYSHTATLLGNGRVLVAGGSTQITNYLASAELYDPQTGLWESTGSLNQGVTAHTATLLADGRVLITGGDSAQSVRASTHTELYDPQSGSWQTTGDLNQARNAHTAILLTDNRVLVTGGYDTDLNPLNSAEIYDLQTNAWQTTGNMNETRRELHITLLADGRALAIGGTSRSTAELYTPDAPSPWQPINNLSTDVHILPTSTLLQDGRVLVAGGSINGEKSAEIFNPQTGTWELTQMNQFRRQHTATLLNDGRVLITGGDNDSNPFSSAEIYDPQINNWKTVDDLLNQARTRHTATLLADGRVLVAGGYSNGNLASAEIFDPQTDTWETTGSLNQSRSYHTATLLSDGRVLVTGGSTPNSFNSAEIYDPQTGIWQLIEPMSQERQEHTATLLTDGRVLIAGGKNAAGTEMATTEIYNPQTGVWQSGPSMNVTHVGHAATRLPDGSILVTGREGEPQPAAELYNPHTGTWQFVGLMNTGRTRHTSTLLADGRVFVVGGLFSLGKAEIYTPPNQRNWQYTSDTNQLRSDHTASLLPNGEILAVGGTASNELYNPQTDTWTAASNNNTGRSRHTASLLDNGQLLVAGGSSGGNTLASAERYDYQTATWANTGDMNEARTKHTATLLKNGQLLVAGGDNNGTSLSSTEIYDPATDLWQMTGNMTIGRTRHTATLLADGRILVTGGANNGNSLASAEIYNPQTATWTSASNMSTARQNHTATLLFDGRVLVTGSANNGNTLASAEIYNPLTNTWSSAGNMAQARGFHTATLLPNGRVLVAGGWVGAIGGPMYSSVELYDPQTNSWQTVGSMNRAHASHTATMLLDGRILILGFISAGFDQSQLILDAELYELPSYATARPTLDPLTSFPIGNPLTLTGNDFRNSFESSSGSTGNSATNYPLVQIRSLGNEQTRWLLPDPNQPFTASSFTSLPVSNLSKGYAMVTVFVNAIPSESQLVLIEEPLLQFALDETTVPENEAAGYIIGRLSNTKDDETLTYELTGEAINYFELDGADLKTTASFNFEERAFYTIQVKATGEFGFTVKEFTIEVLDVDEAPTGVNLSNRVIPENQPASTAVGTLQAVDEDQHGDTHTFALVNGPGTNNNNLFRISGNNLYANKSFNYETDARYYTVLIQATDTEMGATSPPEQITISINDQPEAPTAVLLADNHISENQPNGTIVGTLTTADEDSGSSHTYQLVTGSGAADNNAFYLSGATVRAKASFDYETRNSYSIRVQTTDNTGRTFAQALTVLIDNANDAPTDISLNGRSIPENKPSNTLIGSFSTTDVDPGNTHTYALVSGNGSTDNNSFLITNGNQLRSRIAFDYEQQTTRSIRVRSTDNGGASREEIFTIQIIDLADGPPAEVTKCFNSSFSLIDNNRVKVRFTNMVASQLSISGCRVTGKMHVTLPGNPNIANIDFVGRVDKDNVLYSNSDEGFNLPDDIAEFNINLSGFNLAARSVIIEYYQGRPQLRIQRPILSAPKEWGGFGSTIYNPTIIDSTGVKFGTGTIYLPKLETGGFALELSGSLNPVSNGYQLTTSGDLTIPNVGKKKGTNNKGQECTISASVTIFINTAGDTVMLIDTPAGQFDSTAANGINLDEIALGISCSKGIPIGNTGFAFTGLSGSVTLRPGEEAFDLTVTVSSAKELNGTPVISADGTLDITINPQFSLELIARLYVLSFETANASIKVSENSFATTLNINAVVAKGNVSINAWSDRYGFHFTGSGRVKVKVEKHEFWEHCVTFPCNPQNTCWAGPFPYPCDFQTCRTCVGIPPFGFEGPEAGIEGGEFTGPIYGFKGYVNFEGINYGFFIDSKGKLTFGDVSRYVLASGRDILQYQQQWQEAQADGLSLDPRMMDNGRYQFPSADTVIINTNMQNQMQLQGLSADTITETRTITKTANTAFIVGADAHLEVSIISPDGQEITPTNYDQPEIDYTVHYTEVTSYELARSLGDDPTNQAYLRFTHASSNPAYGTIDLLIDDAVAIAGITLNPTQRAPLPIAVGEHIITIRNEADEMISTTLTVEEGQMYTVLSLGHSSTRLLTLTDDNSPPEGKEVAKVRFVNGGDAFGTVNVLFEGTPIVNGLAVDTASAYQQLSTTILSPTIAVIDSDTAATLISVQPVTLNEGNVYTIILVDNTDNWMNIPASLQTAETYNMVGLQQLDEAYTEQIHIRYDVLGALLGNWQLRIDGDLETTDYTVAVLGLGNPPKLSDVTVNTSTAGQAEFDWSLTADHTPTQITIFANPEDVSQTLVYSGTNGETISETIDVVYQGFEVAQFDVTNTSNLMGQIDSHSVDLSVLESGTYYFWLRADDGRNIASQYAGSPLDPNTPLAVVIDNSASFPTTWEPNLVTSVDAAVQKLYVEWPAPHLDIDEYFLHVGPTAISVTQVISAGGAIQEFDETGAPTGSQIGFTAVSNIEPEQAYYLSVEGVDTDTGRSVKSTPTLVEFSQGEFDLVDLNGVLRVLQVEPGVFNTFSLTLQVSEELFYPDVNLIVDNSQLPSGILAQFVQEEDGFTLIQSGQTVQLDIYVDGVITEGTYPLPIIAYNGQSVKRLDYFVVVGEPNCDPKADLTGDFVDYTQYKVGTITNNNINPLCSYDVGMASYEKFNNKISDQRIFDWDTFELQAGQTVTLEVAFPDCATQVDIFYGPVLMSLATERYGERLLRARHIGGTYYCDPAAPDGVITGRVLGPQTTAVPDVPVMLYTPGPNGRFEILNGGEIGQDGVDDMRQHTITTAADGGFRFSGLPRGIYAVGYELNGESMYTVVELKGDALTQVAFFEEEVLAVSVSAASATTGSQQPLLWLLLLSGLMIFATAVGLRHTREKTGR